MDVTDTYDTIASGAPLDMSDEDLRWVRKPLYEKALREVDATDATGRLGALRVAAWLGLDRAIAVPAKLVRDRDRAVRVSAFNLAVAAGDHGRALLRDVLLGADPQLSAASLELLGRLHDQSSLVSARRHIAYDDPSVQVAAIRLVGLVGGASVRPALAERPEDADAVKAAKSQARAWLDGDEERPPATPWWGDGPHAIATDDMPIGPDAEPVFTASGHVPPAAVPPKPTEPAATESAADAPAVDAPSGSEAAPEPPTHALVPAGAVEAPSDGPTSLPDPLPDEPRALAKLYGMVDAEGRGALRPQLDALDASDLAAVWMGWNPGSDPAVGRGIALAAADLGRTAFLSKARSMLRADDAGVRGAAATALGALGGMSTLTALRPLLADDAATVRAATIQALARLSQRVDREGMARSWVDQLPDDEAPEVLTAIAAWSAS